jgi:hypothetical protein
MCECLDFQARHQNCKHIHAVVFSKLLRKKIYQDAILQPLQELQAKEVNPNVIELGQIVCPKCFSQTYQKFGVSWNQMMLGHWAIERHINDIPSNLKPTFRRILKDTKAKKENLERS